MKVTVRDAEALHSLKPLETAAYLRSKGWKQEADFSTKGSLWLWQSPSGEEFDVTLLFRRELADYTLRMGELLRTLALAEQRSELDVLRDIQTTTSDLIRIRASSKDIESGTLPLDHAVNFVERSRDMMLAAACAAITKRSVYAKRKPTQAMDYLNQAQMGQSEHGSYVLTILSPVAPELKSTGNEALSQIAFPDPYERKVTHTLMDALSALGEAAQEAGLRGDMEPFDAAVCRGVSANLCESVVELSTVGSDGALDVQVAWSRSRPVGENMPSRILLDSDSIRIIEEAGRRFRATATIDDCEIQGPVIRLERDDNATEGDITVVGNVDGQVRRVLVRLDTENYNKAVQAHRERRDVVCTGELLRERQSYRLQNPRGFEVLIEERI
jgi:hypothetical protein